MDLLGLSETYGQRKHEPWDPQKGRDRKLWNQFLQNTASLASVDRTVSLICMESLAAAQMLCSKLTDGSVGRWGLGVVTGSLGKCSDRTSTLLKGTRDSGHACELCRVRRCPPGTRTQASADTQAASALIFNFLSPEFGEVNSVIYKPIGLRHFAMVA